jgi:hypothetical protein
MGEMRRAKKTDHLAHNPIKVISCIHGWRAAFVRKMFSIRTPAGEDQNRCRDTKRVFFSVEEH